MPYHGAQKPKRTTQGEIVRKLILVAVLCVAGYYYYQHYRQPVLEATAEPSDAPVAVSRPQPVGSPAFRCEGKTRCHQMTSCEEAKFYLHNCPGVTIDGDNDGVPCEREHCSAG